MPTGSHFAMSSENDEAFACDAGKASGLSTRELIKRAATLTGGGLAIDWLLYDTSRDRTSDNPPLYQPLAPDSLPAAWDQPIATTASALQTLNPSIALTDADAQAIAKQCLWLTAQTELGFPDCARENLPIFVTGGNVMEATNHDLQAIGSRPALMSLNYDGLDKSRSWLLTDPRCQGLVGGDTGMQCHEYPYNKTEQGGQSGNPSIAPVPSSENQSQGGSFGAGIVGCAMRPAESTDARGDAFLVVPVPVETVPTLWLCNGKSASSQPAQPPSPGG
jgi:hypothetical protein